MFGLTHQCPKCEHTWQCIERNCQGALNVNDARCLPKRNANSPKMPSVRSVNLDRNRADV